MPVSSQNRASCEAASPFVDSSSPSLSKERFRFSPETLLIPVVIATRLGSVTPSTTLFEILRQTVCKLSAASHHDPVSLGPSPRALCDVPEVVKNFATVITMLGIIGGISSMVGCGILSYISPRYGRKPAFLFMLIIELTWSCLIPASQFMPGRLADGVFFFGVLLHTFSDALPYTYLVDLYIVDVCVPEERTSALSKMAGWASLGIFVPHAVGGSITTATGNPFIVFYIAITIFVAVFVYIVSVLPETFPEEKRNAFSCMHSKHSVGGIMSLLVVFEPLKMLVPTRTMHGTRNWRLTWCAVHILVFMVGHNYALPAWQVLVTSKYHLTPADTGIFFTAYDLSGMLVLTAIIPPLVRVLRPYYKRQVIYISLMNEGVSDDESLSLPPSETSDYLDVHLAIAACIFEGISFLCAPGSSTTLTLILSGILVGFGRLHSPTTRSLVAGSVNPLSQGEALAAIEMIHSTGKLLSPLIMGSIFTATVGKAPMLFFYVHLIVVLISVQPLLLIRDEDGYHRVADDMEI